jgi:hypothetical protein
LNQFEATRVSLLEFLIALFNFGVSQLLPEYQDKPFKPPFFGERSKLLFFGQPNLIPADSIEGPIIAWARQRRAAFAALLKRAALEDRIRMGAHGHSDSRGHARGRGAGRQAGSRVHAGLWDSRWTRSTLMQLSH